VIAATLILSAAIFLLISCGHRPYNPALYSSYDTLNPGPEVRLNPLAFTPDGNLIVNKSFLIWVLELQNEIKSLREKLRKVTK
jgi:hypothetical protein